jgi:hypothetical protein
MRIRVDEKRLGGAIAWTYKHWARCLRYRLATPEGLEGLMAANTAGRPVVMCLWHGELFGLLGFGLKTRLPLGMISSLSRDGDLMHAVLTRLGFGVVRGSSSRGGLRALVGARRLMTQEGRFMTITVDGPRGPRREIKTGALYLAAKTGAEVVPVRCRPHLAKTFRKAWDRFELPYPFSYCTIGIGSAFKVDENRLEAGSETLSKRMADLGRIVGRDDSARGPGA